MNSINKSYIKYSSPDIRVKFIPVKGEEFTVKTIEFGGLILSLQTNKSVDSLPGNFSITMVGKDIFSDFIDRPTLQFSPYEVFKPASLVEIYINNVNVMTGIIDGITKTVTMDQKGKPQKNYNIVGRDLGAFLVMHKIWYDDVLYKSRKEQNSLTGSLRSFGMIGGEKSGEIIEKVINSWMIDVINQTINVNNQDILPFQYSGLVNKNIQDRFIAVTTDKAFHVTPKQNVVSGPGALSVNSYCDEYPINIAMTQLGGSLETFLKNVMSAPFNEFFVETGDPQYDLTVNSDIDRIPTQQGKCYVVFRPTPFDDSNFETEGTPSKLTMDNLFAYEIDDTIIKSKTLNMNRNKSFSTYYCEPSNQNMGFAMGKYYTPGEYDEEALRRYGYNPLKVQLNGYEVSKQESGKVESVISDFQKKLKSWHKRADQYLQGSINIKGSEHVRIGNKLVYARDEFGQIEDDYHEGYYYISSLTHNWEYGRSFDTIINVERGVSKKILKREPKFEGILGENLTDILTRIV